MTALIALKSSRVVTPEGEVEAAVVVRDGIICDVTSATIPDNVEVLEFGNLVISPGVIDTHVHINDPGTDWEGFESATAAAAAGGVTTLMDMPLNSIPVTTTAEALEAKRTAASGRCCVDVGFYGGIVPANLGSLEELLHQGVFGLKAFLCDSGLDEFPATGEEELRHALGVAKEFCVPLLAHAEIVTAQTSQSTKAVTYADFARSRPAEFELSAIELLVNLCREFETPVHIVHLATARALPLIRKAKKEGLPLTVETCPHYLLFHQESIGDGDTRFKCAPPIRDDSNRKALCDAVENGLIDTIGSDHSPCPLELKRLDEGRFDNAWGGIAGLQLLLSATWTAGRLKGWDQWTLAERMSRRPAEIFSIAGKGQIKSGFDADLVIWDPDEAFEVDAQLLRHRHRISAYHSRKLFGKVHQTYLRGSCIFDSKDVAIPTARKGVLLCREQRIADILNASEYDARKSALEKCCASVAWVDWMMAFGDFSSDGQVMSQVEKAASLLSESDWLEAFAAHPRIGDIDSLREKFADTKQLASGEQSAVSAADGETLDRLAQRNDQYFEKFGFIFIVFATGKSAAEMLGLLEDRIGNDRDTEVRNAAAEQLKITKLRLRKLAL